MIVFISSAITDCALAQTQRSVQALPPVESVSPPAFDAGQSSALFVGIREFTHDRQLTTVPYAVDDAVDLAHAMAVDRAAPLVRASRIVLALSGEPQKAASQASASRSFARRARPFIRPDRPMSSHCWSSNRDPRGRMES